MNIKKYLSAMLVTCAILLMGSCSGSPKNIKDIEGAEVSYSIKDEITGVEYQVVCVMTVPNKEYEVKLESGKTVKVIDDIPMTLNGVADMEGNIVVPLEFYRISAPVNGYFKVEMHQRPEHYAYEGVYKDGKPVVEVKYHSLEVDSEGKGAFGKISNGDGLTQKLYAIDFSNGAKATLLPYNSLGSGIQDGKIHVCQHNKQIGLYQDYWFDFAGNPISGPEL